MRMIYLCAVLIACSTVLLSCTLLGYNVAQDTIAASDKHTDCTECHRVAAPRADTATFAPNVDPSIYCLNCHRYTVNHHPVDVVPGSAVNESFPLYRGKITCITCHDIHGGPKRNLTPGLLRGGPYADRRGVCFKCHTFKKYANVNPHIMMTEGGGFESSNGRVICLTCHDLEPDPTLDRANMVLFKADIGFLCLRCHPIMRHADYFRKHFLKVPSPEMRTYMERPEIQEKYSLPLVPRERITCSTCHNPHQQGVIAYGPSAAGADSLHRLRDDNICAGCHLQYSAR